MEVYLSQIGSKYFLVIEEVVSIPLDSIKEFRYNPPNGGCSNSLAIIVDSTVSYLEEPNYIFAYENAEAIKSFIKDHQVFLDKEGFDV